jgi:UTP--glucose-1-phosphate uridylyltransferase
MTPERAREPFEERFAPFAEKMRREGLPELMIHVFEHYYGQLVAGATGEIRASEALPVPQLPDYGGLTPDHEARGIAVLDKAIMLKLNGGLGTSMGMDGPKSLLPVKAGKSFLDITVLQLVALRKRYGVQVPLVLMNSFNTHVESIAALEAHPEFNQGIPFDFLQHKEPKVWKADLTPAEWPADPEKEWCPPGHGDIYAAMETSGILQTLLAAGYEYAFVSNSDNLGATLDPAILGYFAQERLPFLMETAIRTPADSKGGHLAARPDGQLVLREIAQCPADELDEFQNIERYRFFNTNNLWIHLPTLHAVITEREGVLGLPLIRNEKPVDPTQPDSPRVYQLETAMGSAIAVFAGAQALSVPRSRFLPVKNNTDLLVLLSDAYELTPDYGLNLVAEKPPLVKLDDRYYKLIDDARVRFPHGAPSLVDCTELRVDGDVRFGKDVVLQGKVRLANEGNEPLTIADGTVIRGE